MPTPPMPPMPLMPPMPMPPMPTPMPTMMKRDLFVLGELMTVVEVVAKVFVIETPQVLGPHVDELCDNNLKVVEPGTWQMKNLRWCDVEGFIGLFYKCMSDVGASVAEPTKEDFDVNNTSLADVNKAVGAPGKTTLSYFDVHIDNGGGVSGQVWTAIVYRDCTAKGGELKIFAEEDGNSPLVAKIACSGMVIMCGDVPHCPAPIEGPGRRDAVIVQLRALP